MAKRRPYCSGNGADSAKGREEEENYRVSNKSLLRCTNRGKKVERNLSGMAEIKEKTDWKTEQEAYESAESLGNSHISFAIP